MPTSHITPGPSGIELPEVFGDFAAMQPPFRGQIWELCADAPMETGHDNKGQPFDIRTACYLREPLMAMRDPAVRKVVIKGGVKTVKTFICEEACAYQVVTGSGDVGFYMSDAEMVKDHATGRMGRFLRSVPAISKMIETIGSRHDDNTNEIYFPGKVLRMWPANYSSTQNVNLETVIVCDAHCIGKTGLIDQIIQRTSQYVHTRKIR